MPTSRRFGAIDAVLFLLILAIAGGARAWYLTVCADSAQNAGPWLVQEPSPRLPGSTDTSELDSLVTNLAESHSFRTRAPFAAEEETTAHASPGFPWLIYWFRLAFNDGAAHEAQLRWLQAGLGALTAGFYCIFALKVFRARLIGLLAGLLCALHPLWIANTAAINDGTLASFLLAVCLLFATLGEQNDSAPASLFFGLALAGLALVRAALLPFAFAALFCYVVRARERGRGWLLALLAILGFANGLAPWAIRNYKVFHDAVPIVDSAYVHLWMGNNPASTGGVQDQETMPTALAGARGEDPKAFADRLAQLPQIERYDEIGKEVVKQIRRDPAGTAQRRIQAALAFVLGGHWFKDHQFYETATEPGAVPDWLANTFPLICNATMLLMVLLGLLGWRWSQAWRGGAVLAAVATVWLPLPYIVGHAEGLSGPRLPLDGVLLTFAALAICRCISLGAWPARNLENA